MGYNAQAIIMRGSLAGIWGLVVYYAGNLTPLFYLMIIFGIVDIFLEMVVARWYSPNLEDGWCSKLVIQGFIQKIACIFLVGVAWGIDFMILEADKTFNLPMNWGPYFGLFALCYLILSDGISIIENIDKIGVNIPFLTSALKYLKEKISKGPQRRPVETHPSLKPTTEEWILDLDEYEGENSEDERGELE